MASNDTHELVIAGPGCGKTRYIVQQVIMRLEAGYQPHEIVVTTFTNSAVDELYSRIFSTLKTSVPNLRIFTIHSLCLSLLQAISVHIPLTHAFSMVDDQTQRLIWFLESREWGFSTQQFADPQQSLLFSGKILSAFDRLNERFDWSPNRLKEWMQSPPVSKAVYSIQKHRLLKTGCRYTELELISFMETYKRWMWDHRLLDFSLMLRYTLRLLQTKDPNLLKILAPIRYLYIDEYQDINPLQEAFFKELAGLGITLCAVGDDDQSIYGFRGASRKPMLRFHSIFAPVKHVHLNKSHRLPASILKAATQLIGQNKERLLKDLESVKKDDIPLYWVHTRTVHDQWEALVDIMNQCVAKGYAKQLGDIAIVVRSVRYRCAGLVATLTKADIPFQRMGSVNLFEDPLIQAIIKALETVHLGSLSPITWATIVPYLFGDPEDSEYFIEGNTFRLNEDSLDRIQCTPLERQVLSHFKKILEDYQSLRPVSVVKLIYWVLHQAPLVTEMLDQSSTMPYYIGKFLEWASSYDQFGKDNLTDFLRLCAIFSSRNQRVDGPILDYPNAITLLTYHQAKGREFPVVILPDLVASNFPGKPDEPIFCIPTEEDQIPARTDPNHLEWMRTLLYVGITRAQSVAWVMSYDSDTYGKKMSVSPFIQEMKPCLHSYTRNSIVPDSPSLNQNKQEIPTNASPAYRVISKPFSFSQLQTYLRCPFAYKMRYEYRWIPPISVPSALGTFVHQLLHQFHALILKDADLDGLSSTKLNPIKEILWESFQHILSLRWQPWITEHRGMDIWKALERYMQGWLSSKRSVIAAEADFEYPTQAVLIRGKLDLIYRKMVWHETEQKYIPITVLLDFKTGSKSHHSSPSFQDHLQLLFYQLAWNYSRQDTIRRMGYYSFFTHTVHWIQSTQERLNKTRDVFDQALQGIFAQHFPKKRGIVCQRCEFRSVCIR